MRLYAITVTIIFERHFRLIRVLLCLSDEGNEFSHIYPSLLPQRSLKARLVAFSAFLSADPDASASSYLLFLK